MLSERDHVRRRFKVKWSRKFTKAILEDTPIDVYNHGDMKRDFTYVEDLVHAIRLLIDTLRVHLEGGMVPPKI